MDELDQKILTVLRKNARLTNKEIGTRVGLTHSACSRRIKRMEQEGVIKGYFASIDRQKQGMPIHTFAAITRSANVTWYQVAQTLAEIDEVIGCYAVSGDADILVELIARDMDHYSNLVLRTIMDKDGVDAVRSSFVMREVKTPF